MKTIRVSLHNSRKSPGNLLCPMHTSHIATPITESLIVGIYNPDCREVARDTQSAFSYLCSYSTYDIAKAV